MAITETELSAIVQQVMQKLQTGAGAPAEKQLGIFDDMNEAIATLKESQKILQRMPMDCREKIIANIRKKTMENAETLAKMGVEETGMGNVGDKILKHQLLAEKTPGTEDITTVAWSGDRGLTLIEMGPFGVIGAITPCTNPSETILCNSIGMIAGGNTVVFNPHPAAVKVSNFAVTLVNQASKEAGGPAVVAASMAKPTLDTSKIMLSHKDPQSDDLTMLFIHYLSKVHNLVLKNKVEELSRLEGFMDTVAEGCNMDPATATNVNLALEEAVTNVVMYAYPEGTEGEVDIEAKIREDCLQFVISDDGQPFDPTAVPEADVTLGVEERPIGGLGIFLVRKIMDSVEYCRENGRNRLTMTKNL